MTTVKSKSTKKTVNKSPRRSKLGPEAWIDDLKSLPVNDESGQCFVVLLVENSSNETVCTDLFNKAAMNGNRLAIKTISLPLVTQTVKRKMTDSSITPMGLLCSEIFNIVGPNFQSNIPSTLLAPLIKYMILEYKQWNKKVKEEIKNSDKEFDEYQKLLFHVDKSVTSRGLSRSAENRSKLANKKDTGKTKLFTKLRKKGEEWKDFHWIDDSPEDGPDLFVTVSTFYDKDLFLELLKIDVPLIAVIKLELLMNLNDIRSAKDQSVLENRFKRSLKKFTRRSSPFLRTSLISNVSNEEIGHRIVHFWKSLEQLKNNPNTVALCRDVMYFTVLTNYSDLSATSVNEFEEEIYLDISHFLYNLVDIVKRHKEYLEGMEVLDLLDKTVCALSEMNIYNSILDSIPHEVLTIPIIIDAILAQVCTNDIDSRTVQDEDLLTLITESNYNFSHLLQNLNLTYDLFNHPEETVTLNSFSSLSKEKLSVFKEIIKYSDNVHLKTFHINREHAGYLVSRTGLVLETAWRRRISKAFEQTLSNLKLQNICNEVMKVYHETDCHSVLYYVYFLTINSVLNSLILHKKVLKPKGSTRRVFCENSIGESSNILTSCDLGNGTVFMSNMIYIEPMNNIVLLQNLQNMHQEFDELEINYCPFTDQVIFVFHSLPQDREEHWIVTLPTRVPLRDFVEYKLYKELEWEENQLFGDDNGATNSKATKGSDILKSLQDILIVDFDFISLRSLKYQTMMKQATSDKKRRSSKRSASTSKSGKNEFKSGKKRGSSKRSASTSNTGKKKTKQGKTMDVEKAKGKSSNQNTTEQFTKTKFRFLGYDLGGEPMRFQINGYTANKFLDVDCKVTLQTRTRVYGEESHRLIVNVCGHSLYYTYNPKDQYTSSFHVHTTSGIILYFKIPLGGEQLFDVIEKKQSQIQEVTDNQSHPSQKLSHPTSLNILKSTLKDGYSSSTFPCYFNEPTYSEIALSYLLTISLPSGIYTELVKRNDLLYVRQNPLSKCLSEEKFRCCLSSGFILKYMQSGEVIALRANGAIYSDIILISDKEIDVQTISSLISFNENTLPSVSVEKHKLDGKGVKKKPKHKRKSTIMVFENTLNEFILNDQQNTIIPESVYDYNFTSSDGKRYNCKHSQFKYIEDLFISSSPDVVGDCIYSERSDGIETKHSCDGSLVVGFPDGSIIVSTPVEAGEVFCEWSTEELARWFSSPQVSLSKNDEVSMLSEKKINVSDVLSIPKSGKTTTSSKEENYFSKEISQLNIKKMSTLSKMENITRKEMFIPNIEEMTKLSKESYRNELNGNALNPELKNEDDLSLRTLDKSTKLKLTIADDGFIVYNVSYKLEHPSCGAVQFNAKESEIVLDMPQSTRITLKNDGTYDAIICDSGLTVDKSKICLNKLNKSGDVIRTTVINNIQQNSERKTIDRSDYEVNKSYEKSFITQNHERCDSDIFYSTDFLNYTLFIDNNFKCRRCSHFKTTNKITDHDFACFVVDRDLSGFRIVSNSEVDDYTEYVLKKEGFVKVEHDFWNSIFTCVKVDLNESEKWQMLNLKDMVSRRYDSSNIWNKISTYGHGYLFPFNQTQRREKCPSLSNDTVVVRLLQRILPEDESISTYLKTTIEEFKKSKKATELIRVTPTRYSGYLSLDNIVCNPDTLNNIFKEFELNSLREDDEFRKVLKEKLINSIVWQSCTKSKNIRIKTKVEELKAIIRSKLIPPYHKSCFGYAHQILDETLDRVYMCTKSKSALSARGSITKTISQLQVLLSKTNSESNTSTHNEENNIPRSSSQISGINTVNLILDKMLDEVICEDVELLTTAVKRPEETCPYFVDDEISLEDILDSRHQQSCYFSSLRDFLNFIFLMLYNQQKWNNLINR